MLLYLIVNGALSKISSESEYANYLINYMTVKIKYNRFRRNYPQNTNTVSILSVIRVNNKRKFQFLLIKLQPALKNKASKCNLLSLR